MGRDSVGASRSGFTAIEVIVVVVLVGVLSAIALPYLRTGPAKSGVRGAMSAIASLHAVARNSAISRGRTAVLVIKAAAPATVLVVLRRSGSGVVDTVGTVENLYARFTVALTTTSDSVIFTPRGIGIGTSNTTVIATRGVVADTLTISGAGRLIR
jgi:prepilin-type N-terminal cleavage/methylation domain-containing protein